MAGVENIPSISVDETSDKPTIGEWQGKPVISLPTGSKYPFSFGKAKAKLIVKYFDMIKKFAEE